MEDFLSSLLYQKVCVIVTSGRPPYVHTHALTKVPSCIITTTEPIYDGPGNGGKRNIQQSLSETLTWRPIRRKVPSARTTAVYQKIQGIRMLDEHRPPPRRRPERNHVLDRARMTGWDHAEQRAAQEGPEKPKVR